jgi:hypothetical protein
VRIGGRHTFSLSNEFLTIVESLLSLCVKRVSQEEGSDEECSEHDEEGNMVYEEEVEMPDEEDVSF